MELSHLFLIKPHNELARLLLTNNGGQQHVSLIFGDKQLIFKMYDQSTVEDFYTGISQEWVEFVLQSSNSFLLDEGEIMDEYILHLN